MCGKHRNLLQTLMLLFLSGAVCSQCRVEYEKQRICAVKGSSVVIHCSFYYPEKWRVKRVMWGHDSFIFDGPFKFDSEADTDAASRLKYIGNKKHNCSLKIEKVEHNDTAKYAFRFLTDVKSGRWTGKDGSVLKVTDLKILMNKTNENRKTKEGDSVDLTCINDCDHNHLSVYMWFKNREHINEGPVLHLSNVSSTDSGKYACSLKTNKSTTSAAININVEYGPKNTSVSVRPSMEVEAGGNFTLICSSHANPPVENYTWFKLQENKDMTDVGHQPVFISTDGGQYFCSATNKHGSQNSAVVIVKIKESTTTFNRDVLIISTAAVLLIVTITAVTRLKKKRTRPPETNCEEDVQDPEYVNWPFSDTNQSHERSQCDGTSAELIYATVDFHAQKTPNMEQQMDSNQDGTDVIYSTVCWSQQLSSSYAETP